MTQDELERDIVTEATSRVSTLGAADPAIIELLNRCQTAEKRAEEAGATKLKALDSSVRYFRDLQKAQRALCPTFGDCADSLADGEKCACGFEDGPWGNAIPPNRAAITAESERDSARASLARVVEGLQAIADGIPGPCLFATDLLIALHRSQGDDC